MPEARPAGQIGAQRGLEQRLGVLVVGQQRPGVAHARVEPRRGGLGRQRLQLLQHRPGRVAVAAVRRGLGQVADGPGSDEGVVGGVGGVEDSPQVLVGVAVAPGRERGQAPGQLGDGQQELAPRGSDGLFGRWRPGRRRLRFSPQRRQHCLDDLGACCPQRLPGLGGQPAGFLGGGHGHLPVGEIHRGPCLEREQPREVAEPTLGAQSGAGGARKPAARSKAPTTIAAVAQQARRLGVGLPSDAMRARRSMMVLPRSIGAT